MENKCKMKNVNLLSTYPEPSKIYHSDTLSNKPTGTWWEPGWDGFPGNQRDGVGKKIVLKRHYIEVREFGEEYVGKISRDCNSCAAIPAAGFIHIECIADTQDLFGKTVIIFTEFRKIMVSQIINGQDKGLLL